MRNGSGSTGRALRRLATYGFVTLGALASIFPLYYMVVGSVHLIETLPQKMMQVELCRASTLALPYAFTLALPYAITWHL